MELIQEDFYKGNHGKIIYRAVRMVNRREVRVTVERDSYDHQSFAIAQLFDGDKWNTIDSLPRAEMDTLEQVARGFQGSMIPAVSTGTKENDITKYRPRFENDADKLFKRVVKIVRSR